MELYTSNDVIKFINIKCGSEETLLRQQLIDSVSECLSKHCVGEHDGTLFYKCSKRTIFNIVHNKWNKIIEGPISKKEAHEEIAQLVDEHLKNIIPELKKVILNEFCHECIKRLTLCLSHNVPPGYEDCHNNLIDEVEAVCKRMMK